MAITQFEEEREGKEREKKPINAKPDLTTIYAPGNQVVNRTRCRSG
jgi:hypothetical protein